MIHFKLCIKTTKVKK